MNRRDFALQLVGALAGAGLFTLIKQRKQQMKILIETIPHSEQRYPTVGDWYWKSSRTEDFTEKSGSTTEWSPKDTLVIRVSEMSDWRYEALVGLHEAIEAILCKQAGVTEAQVDAFDLSYEHIRKPGDTSEPGDDLHAPYHDQHHTATIIEEMLAMDLRVDWESYEKEVDSL
jgi:hypothetical protein